MTHQDKLNYLKEYREKHKDHISELKKQWYQDHKIREREKRRQHYRANRQSYIDRAAKWSKANPEKMKLARRNWRLNNMEYMNTLGANYRARKRGTISEKYNRLIVYEEHGGNCGICHKLILKVYKHPHPESFTIDHIYPLSLGGQDIISNLQPAHFKCNSGKRNRI